MSEKCVVPNCRNLTNTGIRFPKEKQLCKKWLESLSIPNFVPTLTSFVCLDHFDKLNDIPDENLEDVLKTWSIPTVLDKEGADEKNKDNVPQKSESKDAQESTTCRLCMNNKNITGNVFDYWEDEDITIAQAITRCIPVIKIAKQDILSKDLCNPCVEIIKLFYKFRNSCIKMDAKQRKPVNKWEKRKLNTSENTGNKRFCVDSTRPNIQKEVTLTSSKETNTSVEIIETDNTTYEENSSCETKKTVIDQKFDQVEAELMKALEGKLTEEMKEAENIIIEVHNDDIEDSNVAERSVITGGSNVVKIGSDELKLPKGIKVTVPLKYQSKIGVFQGQIVEGMYDIEFCLADDYLYEFRLSKGNIRNLKCLVEKCEAIGYQTVLNDAVESNVTVKMPHNHPQLSEVEIKKQIFIHTIRRKMQHDKTLNFRSVYEDMCEIDSQIKDLIPLRTVINDICNQQLNFKGPPIKTFEQFYSLIESDQFQGLHFTHANRQFYQERFTVSDGSKAIIFANCTTIKKLAKSEIMYVDASFKIDTKENFKYHLVTILVWYDESYFPILFALVNEKSQEIYRAIFSYLRNTLAPELQPKEIVTDYEANLYYSLAETYLNSHIGGSVFYYTQNLYKKICSLNLSRELETNSCFRNIYHMILMLPLLPVNTILDGLNNIELQASELGSPVSELTTPIFDYLRSEWMEKVTPELFCVHRLENRINENVIAPFKKLRDFLMLSKGKMQRQQITIVSVVEKLIELEGFLQVVYTAPSKKSFARDLSSSQKKNVIRAWQFIENHPKININNFFTKVIGYIKCMENQLWIWGFYRYNGDANDELINAVNFSITSANEEELEDEEVQEQIGNPVEDVVVDVVIDQHDEFLISKGGQRHGELTKTEPFESAYLE